MRLFPKENPGQISLRSSWIEVKTGALFVLPTLNLLLFVGLLQSLSNLRLSTMPITPVWLMRWWYDGFLINLYTMDSCLNDFILAFRKECHWTISQLFNLFIRDHNGLGILFLTIAFVLILLQLSLQSALGLMKIERRDLQLQWPV